MFSAKDVSHTAFDIFLSHSFLDRNEVEGLYIELTRLGYSVYVDWIIDPHLDRQNVTKASAALVRKRMKSSRSLLLAISVNASISKWMPWELGYVDGRTERCAIIPVSRERYNAPRYYKGTEYLSLYPFVRKIPTKGNGEQLFVIEDSSDYVLFHKWLSGEKPKRETVNIFNID